MTRFCLVTLGFCIWALAACGDFGDSTTEGRGTVRSEFLDALPDPDMFLIVLPVSETGGTSLTFWRLTQGQGSILNNAITEVVGVMSALRPYPPTTQTAENVLWELQTPIGSNSVLAPRFSLSKDGEDTFLYSLAQRNLPLNGTWVEVLNGSMTPDPERPNWGQGTFVTNYTALAQADSTQRRRGHMTLDIAESEDGQRHLRYTFSDYLAHTETGDEPRSFTVDYYQEPDGSGRFNYATWFNWIGTEKPESFVVRNRWRADGAGVVQVTIRGEEIAERRLDFVEIRECWSAAFSRTYYVQYNHWSATGETKPDPTRDSERGNPDACVFPFESPAGQ